MEVLTEWQPEQIIATGIAVTWWYASKLNCDKHDIQAKKTAREIVGALHNAGWVFERQNIIIKFADKPLRELRDNLITPTSALVCDAIDGPVK